MTASTPRSDPVLVAVTTGIPPPPCATTTKPASSSACTAARVEDLERLRRGDHPAPALRAAVLPDLTVLDHAPRPRRPAGSARSACSGRRNAGRRRRPASGSPARLAVAVCDPAPGQRRRRGRSSARSRCVRLGLRAAPVQRHRRDDGRRELVLDQQVADLRAVAVGDHDLDAERRRARRPSSMATVGRRVLVLGPGAPVRTGHRVAAKGDQHSHATNAIVRASPHHDRGGIPAKSGTSLPRP